MTTNTLLPSQAAHELLREVREKGLIYWEPTTDRGRFAKNDMLDRIDACLAGEREPAPSSERELLREASDWLSSIGLPGGVTDNLRDRIDAYLASTTQEPAEFHMGGAAAAYAVTEPAQEPALDLHTLEEADTPKSAQDKADADAAIGRGPVNCTYSMRARGQAYPRTCERCRLGPCPFYQDDRALKGGAQ